MNSIYDEYKDVIERLYAECEILGTALSKWEIGFVESLYDQFTNKKFLTEKQISCLEKIYDKIFLS